MKSLIRPIALFTYSKHLYFIYGILFLFPFVLQSQNDEVLKCGEDNDELALESLQILGDHWGYGYDSLLADMAVWEESEFVKSRNIGMSVEGRPLWELEISNFSLPEDEKTFIYIHARTHPNEVQGSHVTNEIIDFLLSDEDEATILRSKSVFFILPMINPDGVELEIPRKNANNIDLESNWFSLEIQPEVISLKARFRELMQTGKEVAVALNMHSAYACKRYFVYHHQNGTSANFASLEKEFINGVRQYYPEGIENWDYYISWSGGTPQKYPESWWWLNYGEAVMALTYEDMNCDAAGNYERTAEALLKGIADYVDIELSSSLLDWQKKDENTITLFPNPVSSGLVRISLSLVPETKILSQLIILDASGLTINHPLSEILDDSSSEILLDISMLNKGIYFIGFQTSMGPIFTKLIIH